MKHAYRAALALCLAHLPGSTALAQPPDPSGQLEALIAEYVAWQRQDDGRDPIFTQAAFESGLQKQKNLLDRLRALDGARLDREQLTDRRYLLGVLETDMLIARQQRRWENDPGMYLPSRALGLLLDPTATDPAADRAEALEVLLERASAQFGLARESLGHPPRRFTREAIFQARNTLDSIQEGSAAFAGLPVRDTLDRFFGALEAHVAFLENELLPRSTGSWMFGRDNYERVLRERWFLDADAADMLERGKRAFAETEALAQEVAERIRPGAHWTEVYEQLAEHHPPAAGIKQAYQAQMDAARAFVINHQLVSLPAGERVVTIDTPPAMRRSSPFGTFQSVSPHDQNMEGKLILTPIESWMSEEQREQRLRSHHDAWIPVIAVHEAYPGHHVHALKLRENSRVLRRVAREPIFVEGWGLFTEELMFELGFLRGDDVRLTQLRNRLWRAARVILDASLHTGQMTFDDAVRFLVDKVRFEPYAAELEVGMYIRRPTYVLGYLVGMQELMAIREEYVSRFGEPEPPSQFYDRLLSVGALPPALVRAELLDPERG